MLSKRQNFLTYKSVKAKKIDKVCFKEGNEVSKVNLLSFKLKTFFK